MKNIFITFDYELFFGDKSGTLDRCIIYPTELIVTILEKYNAKATFFVDSGYLIKLQEYKENYTGLEEDYKKIVQQIQMLSTMGHDIQLHIHPHWEDTIYNGKEWKIDTKRYRLHDFKREEREQIVSRYKQVLENVTKKKIFVYRAGGWCLQPFGEIADALKKNEVWLDSTVFKGGKNKSSTHYFDFVNAPAKSEWRFEDDPLKENPKGSFLEVPISHYRVSPLFFWKLAFYKKFGGNKHKAFGDGQAIGGSVMDKIRMLLLSTDTVVSTDGLKASYLEKAFEKFLKYNNSNIDKNFVTIGHPKAMTPYSLQKMDTFIAKYFQEHNFTTYSSEFI